MSCIHFRGRLAVAGTALLASWCFASGWSPKIVYLVSDNNGSDIWSMNLDGSGKTRLTPTSAREMMPAINPAGTKIAFVSNASGKNQVYYMNIDGSNVRRVTSSEWYSFDPSWSPDGRRIVYMNYVVEGGEGNQEIFVINADGTGVTRLTTTPTLTEREPSWSPDGTMVAYERNSDICVMNADGSRPTQITFGPDTNKYPSWSADSSKIVFSRTVNGETRIWVMNADGSNMVRLTNLSNTTHYDEQPCFDSTGTKIAFAGSRPEAHIWLMDADGSNQWRLTDDSSGRNTDPSMRLFDPILALPGAFTVTRGIHITGGLTDLFSSDDRYLAMAPRPPFLISDPSIQFIVTSTASQETAQFLLFRFEASCNAFPSSRAPQRIELYNFEDGRWEFADERTPTFNDSIVEVTYTENAQRFIEPGTRAMKARISYFDNALLTANWFVAIDQTVWEVTP